MAVRPVWLEIAREVPWGPLSAVVAVGTVVGGIAGYVIQQAAIGWGSGFAAKAWKLGSDELDELLEAWKQTYVESIHQGERAFTAPIQIVARNAKRDLDKVKRGVLDLGRWLGIYDPLHRLEAVVESLARSSRATSERRIR